MFVRGGRRVIGISGSLMWSKTLMELIFNPVVNFGEVRRAQLAKSTLMTSSRCPWDIFRSFKVCSDAKERVGCGKQPHLFIPSKLQPSFMSLQWKTCLWAELQSWCLSLQWRTCPWAEQWWWFEILKYRAKWMNNIFMSHGRLARWRKWRACDVGEAKEWLENELWRR